MVLSDSEILVESSNAFLRSVIGDSNWEKWQLIKDQSRLDNIRDFFTWLLDTAEQSLQVTHQQEAQDGMQQMYGEDSSSYDNHYRGIDQLGDVGNADSFMLKSEVAEDDVIVGQPSGVVSPRSHQQWQRRQRQSVAAPYPLPSPAAPRHPPPPASTEGEEGQLSSGGGELQAGAGAEAWLTFGDDNYSDSAFYCHHCNIHLNKLDAAMTHLSKVHEGEGGGTSIRCIYCDNVYPDTETFLESHGQGCAFRLTCRYCQKAFTTKSYLKIHVAKHTRHT